MTQNSDSGDAVGDAGPTNRRGGGCRLTVKIDLTAERALPLKSLRNHIDLDRIGRNAARAAFRDWTYTQHPATIAGLGDGESQCAWMTCRKAATSRIVAAMAAD